MALEGLDEEAVERAGDVGGASDRDIVSNRSCCSARDAGSSAAAKRSFSTLSSASAMMLLSLSGRARGV
jgi:hypothetical protein